LADIYRPDAKIAGFLSVLLVSGVAYGLYRGVQDNYLAEFIHINPFERGIVEFFRELPGFLVIFILALMYRYSDSKVFKIGTAFMAAGIVGLLFTSTGHLLTKFFVVLFMVLYSVGDHITMPVKSTISLDLAKHEKAGASLGMLSSMAQLGQIAGFIAVMFLFFFLGRAGLEVFYGSRKQIFLTFAPYVLILHYGADPSVMSLLYAICAGFGIFCGPAIGRFIDKLGYKTVMVADTLILIVVCILYGFSHRIFPKEIAFFVVCTNFVLDSILSIASMAGYVYVQHIASNQEEITATLSTGVSVNHIISIFIALMGGWRWKGTGIEVLFSISAVLALINCLYAASIKRQ